MCASECICVCLCMLGVQHVILLYIRMYECILMLFFWLMYVCVSCVSVFLVYVDLKRVQLVLDILYFIIWHIHTQTQKYITTNTELHIHRPKCVQILVGCAKRVVPHTTNLPIHMHINKPKSHTHKHLLVLAQMMICMFNSQLNFFGLFFMIVIIVVVVFVASFFCTIFLLFTLFADCQLLFCLFTLFFFNSEMMNKKSHLTHSHFVDDDNDVDDNMLLQIQMFIIIIINLGKNFCTNASAPS